MKAKRRIRELLVAWSWELFDLFTKIDMIEKLSPRCHKYICNFDCELSYGREAS